MEKPHLLIVDDDTDLRTQMKWALADQYKVTLADSREAALAALTEHQPAVATLDLGLPPFPDEPREGFLALAELLQKDPGLKVVVITGQDEKENAFRALSEGAYDFFCKPIQIPELKTVLGRAFYLRKIESENAVLRETFQKGPFEDIIGASPRMLEVFNVVRKVSTSDAPVLVVGESGTGKELVARAIHRRSRRGEKPFIPINCGAIPDDLLESELFGHEKGAFTGAHIERAGRIEAAEGGTLFLDEIGELSTPLQVKLLRFLQDWRIQKVGGREEVEVDARVIAATNTNLQEAMKKGSFREDLFYRLAVVVVELPALRDRDGDVLLLAKYFLQKYAAESRKRGVSFGAAAVQAMTSYRWPGNVRELENRIRRAVIMADGSKLSPTDLGLEAVGTPAPGLGLREAREALERELVQQALARHQGNISRAAEDLQISRPTLYEMMDKLGVKRD